MSIDPRTVPWRVGRSILRTMYARTGGDDWKADTFLGIAETPELAAYITELHNAKLAGVTSR